MSADRTIMKLGATVFSWRCEPVHNFHGPLGADFLRPHLSWLYTQWYCLQKVIRLWIWFSNIVRLLCCLTLLCGWIFASLCLWNHS